MMKKLFLTIICLSFLGCASNNLNHFGNVHFSGKEQFTDIEVPETFTISPKEFFNTYKDQIRYTYYMDFWFDDRYYYIISDSGVLPNFGPRLSSNLKVDGRTGEVIKDKRND